MHTLSGTCSTTTDRPSFSGVRPAESLPFFSSECTRNLGGGREEKKRRMGTHGNEGKVERREEGGGGGRGKEKRKCGEKIGRKGSPSEMKRKREWKKHDAGKDAKFPFCRHALLGTQNVDYIAVSWSVPDEEPRINAFSSPSRRRRTRSCVGRVYMHTRERGKFVTRGRWWHACTRYSTFAPTTYHK